MTKEQIEVGMRVRFTGDAYNFGEKWIVPERDVLGTIVERVDFDSRWDALVRWDKPVIFDWQYYYKAASLSPVSTADF